jgi:release factor glutamine methyltransferase
MLMHNLRPVNLVRAGAERLTAAGVGPAVQEAEWLLEQLLGVQRMDLYLTESGVSRRVQENFWALVARRERQEPLQYLTGCAYFMGLRLQVQPGVFIPRPETEQVVSALVHYAAQRGLEPKTAVELGVGSGCITVTLASLWQACVFTGIDVSYSALCVASANARQHGVADRIQWVQANWAGALQVRFDCMVSNPPYIPSCQVEGLPLDVRQEPRESLDGGWDGMRDLLQLMAEAEALLNPGGILALECAEDQVQPLVEHLSHLDWVAEVVPVIDLAQRPRGVLAARRETSHV